MVELWSLAGRVAASLMDSNEPKLSGPAAAACPDIRQQQETLGVNYFVYI